MNDAQYLAQVTPEAPVARRDLVNRWVFGLAIANVIAQVGIMVTEGMVRVARDGLVAADIACTTWPDCAVVGDRLPFAGYYTTIDVLNWVMMFVVVGVAAALAAAVVQMKPTKFRPRRVHVFAALPLLGVLVQAGLGIAIAFTPAQPWLGVVHATVSALLVALSAWLVNRLISPDVPSRPAAGVGSGVLAWALGVLGLGTAVAGILVTRATTEVGTTLTLPYQLEGKAIGHIHAGLVLALTLVVIIGVVWAVRSRIPVLMHSRRAWFTLLVILLMQGGLGLAQVFLTLSPVSVVVHFLGSGLVITAIMWVLSYLYTRIPVLALAPAGK